MYLLTFVSFFSFEFHIRFYLPKDHEYLSPFIGSKIRSCVVGMATADSSFLRHSTFSIKDPNHPYLPTVLVFINFLTQLEVSLYWSDGQIFFKYVDFNSVSLILGTYVA